MKKLESLGKKLSKKQQKEIVGGDFWNYSCSCTSGSNAGLHWFSDCTTQYCFQLEINNKCGFANSGSCINIQQE